MFILPHLKGLTAGNIGSAVFKNASLDLKFADNKSLVDAVTGASLITFARAYSGTFVDSAGVLQTAAIDVPRFDHNPTTGESLGLLVEEPRTNLLLNSGTLSTQSVTVTAVAHTLSFTGTGTITLTGTSTAGPVVGTGTGEANRVSLTFTPTAGSLTLTVSGTVTNAQLEAGAFRTSYIPTTTAQATRSADVASITGTAFSSWYRQDEGTMFADYRDHGVTGSNRSPYFINDGTVNNRAGLFISGTTTITSRVLSGGVSANPGTLSTTLSAQNRYALSVAVGTNQAIAASNGALASASSPAAMPTVTRLDIGSGPGAAIDYLNGTIRRLTYWPQALPSRLQALTQ
jgi:hypothetical protein